MTISSLLDILILSVIVVCGFDVVRLIHPRRQPWLTAAFVLITIGSFGWMNYDVNGFPVPWYALAMHIGFGVGTMLVLVAQRHATAIRPHADKRGRDWLRDPEHRW